MNKRREVFITREGALRAIIKVCKERNIPANLILKGKVRHAKVRGAIVGYHAFVPLSDTYLEPIAEGMV